MKKSFGMVMLTALTVAAGCAQADTGTRSVSAEPLYKSYVWVTPKAVAVPDASRAAMIDRHRRYAELRSMSKSGWRCGLSGAGAMASCSVE